MTKSRRTGALLAPAPTSAPAPPATAPAFAIAIAAYEAAATIGDALASAFAQTLPPAEVVVCDDGSTDDLARAVAPYTGRIRLLRQSNSGEAAAKNAAVRASASDFVVFLDADDVFLPERLEALQELASSRPDLDILTTDAWIEIDGVATRRCYDESWPFEIDDQRGAILERNFVFGLAAVRRTRFLKLRGFDESLRFAADWDLWCRLILDGARVGLVDTPLARYRLRTVSLSANRAALLQGRCAVLEKALRRDDLSVSERRRAKNSLAANRRAVLLVEAHEAILNGAPNGRSRALALAAGASVPLRTRLRALGAAAAPRLAARALAREQQRLGVPGPAGLRLPP